MCFMQEKELAQFIDVTKHLNGIDRSQMMLQLMRLHGENLACTAGILARDVGMHIFALMTVV